MRIFAIAATAASATLLAGNVHAQPAPALKVQIKPSAMDEAVGKGEVKVKIVAPGVDAPAGASLFQPRGDIVSVTDSQGVVPRQTGEGRGWIPARPVKGILTISYTVKAENAPGSGGTTPIRPRIDGKGFSAIGMTLIATPALKTPYRLVIDWDLSAMGKGATAVSSFGEGDVEAPAGPVARLDRATFMAGKLLREPKKTEGRFSAVWTGDPGFDLAPSMQWTEKLHSYMVDFFRTPNDPRYYVLLRLNGAGNPGGGVAFPNSFFATWGPGVTGDSMKGILGHEMVHTFTATDLGKWFDEGTAVYYQVRLPWRAGMASTEQYLRDINLTAARYYTSAEINSSEDRIIPNFFSNPWLINLGYDRGALYFAILDGQIRRASGGTRSIDDLIRQMVVKQRAGEDIVETTWTDLIGKEIGEQALVIHRSMMSGGIIVPESGDFGPCFRRVPAQIRRYEQGFAPKTVDGQRLVDGVVTGSEAEKAGLRNGQVILQMPVITTEGVKRDPERTLTVEVLRDGKATSITYLPRSLAKYAGYQWERVADVPESACRP